MESLPTTQIILGRDSQAILEIALFNKNDIKKVLYVHKRNILNGIIPNDENIDGYLEKIEYHYAGEPGIYKVSTGNNPKAILTNPTQKQASSNSTVSINTISILKKVKPLPIVSFLTARASLTMSPIMHASPIRTDPWETAHL